VLKKQTITIPISEGLDLKTDQKQVMAGKALQLENVRFYKTGKLQKRFGLTSLITNTQTGTLSDIFAIASDGESISALTSNGAFALSQGASQWDTLSAMKDTVKISSDFVAKSAYNHFNPDMDYNTDLGMIATIYREVQESNNLLPNPAEYVTIVLEDVETGVRKIRKIATGNTNYKKSQQKIMLTSVAGVPYITIFYDASSQRLRSQVLDKNLNDVTAAYTVKTFASSAEFKKYKLDVCRDSANIFLAYMFETSLAIQKLDLTGTFVSNSSKTTTNRLGSVPIEDNGFGFSVCVTTSNLHVFWITNTTVATYPAKIAGIGTDKSLTTNITETASSTDFPLLRDISIVSNGSQIVMATTEGDAASLSGTTSTVRKFTASFAGSYTYSEPSLQEGVHRAVVLSRPYIYDGDSFAVCKCPENDQNTGLILNLNDLKFSGSFSPFGLSSDRLLNNSTADYTTGTCNSSILNGKAYSMVERIYGTNTNSITAFDFNASVAISKLEMDFNIDTMSGVKSKIGETIYYTNGTTFSLDGRGAYESGFFLRPLVASLVSNTSGATTPAVASKTFNYIAVYNYYNGKGELERSIPSPSVQIVTAANTTYVVIKVKSLPATYKDMDSNSVQAYVTEVVLYRTATGGSVFNRVSSVPNSNSVFDYVDMYDAASDADISNNELLYTTGGILESDSTPNAKFSAAGGNRLFLGGLEIEDDIAYSNKQLFGEAVSFSDFYRIRISSGTSADKSKMSALGYLDGKIIIFREKSIYYVAGDGPNETGLGSSYTEPEVISSDVGCPEPRSVINGPTGLLFKSRKGIYLLDRAMNTSYIGAGVEDYNSQPICAAYVSDKYNEARFLTTSGNLLVYNFLFEKWSVFAGQSTIDADIWASNPVSVVNDIVKQEVEDSFTDSTVPYSMKFKSPWLKLTGLEDFGRIWSMEILGTFKSAHTLRISVYVDYNDTAVQVRNITPLITDKQYQYRLHLKQQKCEAMQFLIEDISPVGESMDLSAIALEVGLKKGTFKLNAARKY